jgi:hypothetical protein
LITVVTVSQIKYRSTSNLWIPYCFTLGITPVPPDNLLIWRNLINLEKSNLFSKSVNSFDNSEALEDKHSKQNLKENHEEWSCSENKSPQVGKTKKQHIGRARARVKKQVTICSTQNRDKTQPRTRNKNCQVCQISFNNTSKLKQHVEEHHKEAKVTCEICQKDFGKLTIHNHIVSSWLMERVCG